MGLDSGKHVVIVCPSCDSGGSVATVALKQARELSKHFTLVTLISDGFPRDMKEKVARGLVTPRRFDYLRRFSHVPNEYSFVRSVRRHLEELHLTNRIDMIVCHGHSLVAIAAKPLRDKYAIPLAMVTHGDIFDRPKGTYDGRLTAFYKFVTPVAYKNADLIIALSPYMAECAIKGGAASDSVKVIPNGIDPADIGIDISAPPSLVQASGGALKLLYVGGLSVPKGVDVLISACGILKRRGLSFSLKLIGEGKLTREFREMVRLMDLDERVSFIGKVLRTELGAHYREADLVCVPSISDPLPTVVLESLVSGTPVIGSDVGGIPFMVRTGFNGMLAPPGDSGALAAVIEDLAEDRKRLKMLKENSRSSVFPLFSWESVGVEIRDCIEAISSGGKRSDACN